MRLAPDAQKGSPNNLHAEASERELVDGIESGESVQVVPLVIVELDDLRWMWSQDDVTPFYRLWCFRCVWDARQAFEAIGAWSRSRRRRVGRGEFLPCTLGIIVATAHSSPKISLSFGKLFTAASLTQAQGSARWS
eukprot:SAG11_NODE_6663_length_1271_cov_1.360068_1_plen_136_part_00